MSKLILALSLLIGIYCAEAQNCKVLMKNIDRIYKGDCKRGKADGKGLAEGIDTYSGTFKKGLPDGQGTYTWQNGDVYIGEWKKGMMDGQGQLTKSDGSLQNGYWKKNKYSGQYEYPFKQLDKSTNVSSFNLSQVEGKSNVIRFYFKEDQKIVQNPLANVVVHHGNYTNVINTSSYVELQNVSFPFKAKVYFGSHYIEFEIFKSGMWAVHTNITNIKGLNSN